MPRRNDEIGKLTFEQIIPQNLQDELQALGDDHDRAQWRIGDLTLELEAELYPRVSKSEIWRAVGRYCGKSWRSVREYARVSRHVPLAVRDRFDDLTRSHFRVLIPQVNRRVKTTDVSINRAWILECLAVQESADDFGGQRIPVSVLERQVSTQVENPMKQAMRALVALGRWAEKIEDPVELMELGTRMDVVRMNMKERIAEHYRHEL